MKIIRRTPSPAGWQSVGAGRVEAAIAYALMLRGLFREILLIDADEALARAEARTFPDASALARPARIFAGGYADAADAQIRGSHRRRRDARFESRLAVAVRAPRS